MKKFVLGALGALALCVASLPADAAPVGEAPVQAALYQADSSTATVQTVQYRPYGYGYAGPRRFYRPHRRFYRPPVRGFYGRRDLYRGPGPRFRRY